MVEDALTGATAGINARIRLSLRRVSYLLMAAALLAATAHVCPAATISKADELERLARAQFGDLTDCETRMVRTSASGDVAYCGLDHNRAGGVPPDKGAAHAGYDVRAELVRWLVIDPLADRLIDPKGIQAQSARIRETLDVSSATVVFPLSFTNSVFRKPLVLSGAQLAGLDLEGSHLSGIKGGDLTVRTDVDLQNAISNGMVDLNDGKIGGDLNCSGGRFKNPKGYAIYAESLKVEGRIYFAANFSSEGIVELRGATIGGDLDCSSGKFNNAKSIALSANGVKVRNIFLSDKFRAQGVVQLMDTELSGSLNGGNALLNNPGGDAFVADRMTAHGDCVLPRTSRPTGVSALAALSWAMISRATVESSLTRQALP
jgi:hypothetical protein